MACQHCSSNSSFGARSQGIKEKENCANNPRVNDLREAGRLKNKVGSHGKRSPPKVFF